MVSKYDLFARSIRALDVFVNIVFNGRVETISSRAARATAAGKWWGKLLCKALDRIDPGHCERAAKDPLGGLQK